MNLSPIQATLALVAIGFKERDAVRLLEEAGFDPLDWKQERVISEERLKLEISEWSEGKQSTKKAPSK